MFRLSLDEANNLAPHATATTNDNQDPLIVGRALASLSQQHQHQREEQQVQEHNQLPAASQLRNPTEMAATAMVTIVRLILVILICVLLVKLFSPKKSKSSILASQSGPNSGPKSRNHRRRRLRSHNRNTFESQQQQLDTNNDTFNGDQDNEGYSIHGDTSDQVVLVSDGICERNTFRFFLNFIKNKFSTRNLFDRHQQDHEMTHPNELNQSSQQCKSHLPRRKSQPELSQIQREQQQSHRRQLEASDRRRRHSDTSVSHLQLPPGPRGLPFLGYLPFVGHEIHLTLTTLSQKYGPIYQIFLGGIRVVVLNDASLVRQAFKQPVFSGRPDTQLTRMLQGYGIVNSDGALWKEQRAFLHSALRKLGAKSLMSGSNGLEAKIQSQVKEFVNDLSGYASQGKPCQVRPMVARAVSSVVGSIVMNLTYRKYEEKEKFDRLIELMQEGFRLFTIAMPLDFIPIFRFLPGVSYAYKKMMENRAETSAFFQNVADEHRKYLGETFNLYSTSSSSSLHPKSGSTPTSAPCPSPSQSTLNSSGPLVVGSANFNAAAAAVAATTAANSAPSPAARSCLDKPELPEGQVQATGDAKSCSQVHGTGKSESSGVVSETGQGLAWRETQSEHCNLASDGNNNIVAGQLSACNQSSHQAQPEPEPQPQVELENIATRDLVDAYIVQQKKHEKDGKENYFSDQQLVQIMSDIFSAGLETVTSTIEWSILFLILNKECQEKIHDEIDRIIGRQRMPQLEDLSQMPYTEATIYEVLRRSNVIALGNAHATLADATIGGYRIPKGTQVLPNLYGIHMNPKLWDEPDKFNPGRFIVNDRAQKPEYFIPFSVGRRMCLGDVLAKMEVFLFLIGLLQKYDLAVAEEDKLCPPQIKGTTGVSNNPASFRVALHPRQSLMSQQK